MHHRRGRGEVSDAKRKPAARAGVREDQILKNQKSKKAENKNEREKIVARDK